MSLSNGTNSKKKKPWNDNDKSFQKIDDNLAVYGKVPPQAIELEVYILGAIMLERLAIDIATEILQPESFYVDVHQTIYRTCMELSLAGTTPDLLAVVQSLRTQGKLEEVGGPFRITQITNDVVSTANLEVNCRIVQQKYMQRALIRISSETIGDAYNDTTDVFELLDKHEGALLKLTSGITSSTVYTSKVLAIKAKERVDFLLANKEQLSGVPSGFEVLDRCTNGWQPTDLIILAARPSVGKTAFALNLAKNAATDRIKPTAVGFFSLEMSAAQLANRMLATESKLNLNKISRGRLYDEDYERFVTSTFHFGEMPIYIDDTAALNIFELRAKARRLVSKYHIGLIIIDYLQLMSGAAGHGNREQQVSDISRSLKSLAKQLNIPIIALSQLSRAVETRKEKPEPVLSDLRESGAIEQDADMVMFLFRPDYQEQATEGEMSLKGDAWCKIAKHRNGDLLSIFFNTDFATQTWTVGEKPVLEVPRESKPLKPVNYNPNQRIEKNDQEFDAGLDKDAPF